MLRTIAEIDTLIAVLRKHGVQTYAELDGEIDVEFFAPLPAPVAPVAGTPASPVSAVEAFAAANADPDACPCGHDSAQHQAGTGRCMEGCSPGLCASKRGDAPERG